MGNMKLYELVNQYHIGTNLSCAEAMFKACNEYYHLHLSEETRRMFSVAVGIIGLMTAKDGETDVDNMEGYQMICALTDYVLTSFGTLHCVELQGLEVQGYENPCHYIVEGIAKKLEEILSGGHGYSQMLVN